MDVTETSDIEFEDLIRYVQESRGLDFRGYKRSSLRRRITIRMERVGAEGFSAYQSFLEAHPQEFNELLDTVLINVTSFFRDPEAWDVLRDEVIPTLVAKQPGNGSIRIWSVGCASGEEPYSVAMLLAEALGGPLEFCRRVKIYATDLDETALRLARQGTYSAREVETVPATLLAKYFEQAGNQYVFRRELRRCVVFGRHNIVFDPPISRIDLLLCRNVLIYLGAETQQVVLPRFHYAMADDGFLFLGKAETQLAHSKLFRPVQIRHRLFAKVPQEVGRTAGGSTADGYARDSGTEEAPRTRLLEAMLDDVQTAYLAVDPPGNLIFANTAARRMLEVGEPDIGHPFQDLSISYRPAELRGRIEQAQREGHVLRLEHQEYHRPPADPIRLTIEVRPLLARDGKPLASLLAFSDTTRIYNIQQALEATQERLETTNEELQSANEELETTNEELQSTNEELETTNEELQSTNEELETMNEELRSTNEALEGTNEELSRHSEVAAEHRSRTESILRSVDVGIILLTQNLRVLTWNRWCENFWGVREDEAVGRDLLALDFGLPVRRLQDALESVSTDQRWPSTTSIDGVDRRGRSVRCSIRIFPLTRDDNAANGLMLVIEDVTGKAQMEDFNRHLGRILGQSLNEIYFLDPTRLRFILANHGAEQKLGCDMGRLRQMSLSDFIPGVPLPALLAMIEPLVTGERKEAVVETVIRSCTGREYPAEICLQYFGSEEPPFVLALVHDTTERQALDQAAE
jgi:two-component system, chemotaxis family, CheB/CheR fusion protein